MDVHVLYFRTHCAGDVVGNRKVAEIVADATAEVLSNMRTEEEKMSLVKVGNGEEKCFWYSDTRAATNHPNDSMNLVFCRQPWRRTQ